MRKKNSVYNVMTSIIYYFIAIILNLASHAILVRVLGIEYSGINGLFTNVINLLAVAELGIGNVIIFKLYEPIAKNNIESIKSWLKFYKKCYNVICIAIIVIGILIAPFIKNIIGEVSINENIYILYFISISNVVASYMISYKRSLLNANQKNYIITIINIVYTLILNVLQIIVLIVFKNYILYLMLKTICILLSNVYISFYVNKKYPYVKEKADPINKKEIKNVVKRIKAIFFEKISYVVNKGIDSILITYYLGIKVAGLYNNYQLIAVTLINILFKAFVSIIPSVGNLLVEKNKEKSYVIFKKIFFVNHFLVGLFIICFAACISSFVKFWVGAEYVLSIYVIISFCIYIYCDGIRYSIMSFRDGAGICIEDKYMYLISVIINLILSFTLCVRYGMIGVIYGTAIGYLFLLVYSYPKYTFKKLFDVNVFEYYKNIFKSFILILFGTIISLFISKNIELSNNIITFIVLGVLASSVWIVLFGIFNYKTDEFKYFFDIIKKFLKKRKN